MSSSDSESPLLRPFDLKALLKNRLVTLQAEQRELDVQMAAILAQTTKTQKKIDANILAIQSCKSQLLMVGRNNSYLSRAPIRRLPPEILCEIFQWVVVLHEYTRTVNYWEIPVAPWPLTHVCRDWREVARGCPRLWSTINIVVPDIPDGDMSSYVDDYYIDDSDADTDISDAETDSSDADTDHLDSEPEFDPQNQSMSTYFPKAAVDTQLRLAYPMPLDIVFDVGPFKRASYLCKLLRILAHQSDRWSRLTLKWIYIPKIFSVLRHVKGRLSRLESLKLDVGSDAEEAWPSAFVDVFTIAPRLRHVDATILADILPSDLSLPQHQLTCVQLSSSSRSVLEFLPLMAHTLTEATLKVYEPNDADEILPTLPPVVELPQLQRLSLDNDWGLGCLVVPCLTSLKLDGVIGNIHTVLHRSQCQLKMLDFSCFPTQDVLSSLLSQRPTLSHLRVGLIYDLAGIAPLLDAQNTSDNPPKFVSMEIEPWDARLFEPFCNAAEACWNLPQDIRCLRSVRFPKKMCPPPIWERFEKMRLEGLKVNEPLSESEEVRF
ncbi:hypothetical protein R3P38DRAFT_3003219 [Favolaschia claudopus]|uniref:F-box domain-containing protein n=1 Tax=Favolaschia claudopus TaxID=2862362 RepID=A0AAW0AML8_9AGAR